MDVPWNVMFVAFSCIPSRLSCKEQTVEVERGEFLSLVSLLDLVIIPHIF